MTDEVVLFDGRLGTESVRIWLERHAGGITLLSHDIGPGLQRHFGSDDLETFLEIDAVDLSLLATALGDATGEPMELLAERYQGDSMATTHLRELLSEHAIPHRFSVI